ncbi:MAG: hypothetical protein IPK19_19440 [Chloroflexi bacterium]|nr:hypothetical protein [Chloroflexota bacterium]
MQNWRGDMPAFADDLGAIVVDRRMVTGDRRFCLAQQEIDDVRHFVGPALIVLVADLAVLIDAITARHHPPFTIHKPQPEPVKVEMIYPQLEDMPAQ